MKWLYNWWTARIKRSEQKAMIDVKLNQYLYGTGFLEKRWWGYRSIHPIHVVIFKNRPTQGYGASVYSSLQANFHNGCNYMGFLGYICNKCGQRVTKENVTED